MHIGPQIKHHAILPYKQLSKIILLLLGKGLPLAMTGAKVDNLS